MTDAQERITQRMAFTGQSLTKQALEGQITPAAWIRAFVKALAVHHLAAYADGADVEVEELTPQDLAVVEQYVAQQLEFAKGFAEDLRNGRYDDSPSSALVRAGMYAEATGAAWWMGNTRGFVLPAYPKDGTTQCLTNCQCSWELDEQEDGSVHATWKLGGKEHCQTCSVRADEWNPLIIIDGVVQLKEYRPRPLGRSPATMLPPHDGIAYKGWVTIRGRPVFIKGSGGGKSGGGGGGRAALTTVGAPARVMKPAAPPSTPAVKGKAVRAALIADADGDPAVLKERQKAAKAKLASIGKEKGLDSVEYADQKKQVATINAQVKGVGAGATRKPPAERVREMLSTREPAKFKVEIESPDGELWPAKRKQIEQATQDMQRLVGPGTKLDGKTVKVVMHQSRTGPPYYDPKTGQVHIFGTNPPHQIHHELAHWAEEQGGFSSRAHEFYNRRTAGQSPVALATLYPGAGYGAHEMTVPDKFYHPYAGLKHGGRSTEITSMAVQRFFSDPDQFAREDPDHFDTVWNYLTQ